MTPTDPTPPLDLDALAELAMAERERAKDDPDGECPTFRSGEVLWLIEAARERDRLRTEVARLRSPLTFMGEVDALRSEVEALREDKARLDWIIREAVEHGSHFRLNITDLGTILEIESRCFRGKNPRDIIDAARRQEADHEG